MERFRAYEERRLSPAVLCSCLHAQRNVFCFEKHIEAFAAELAIPAALLHAAERICWMSAVSMNSFMRAGPLGPGNRRFRFTSFPTPQTVKGKAARAGKARNRLTAASRYSTEKRRAQGKHTALLLFRSSFILAFRQVAGLSCSCFFPPPTSWLSLLFFRQVANLSRLQKENGRLRGGTAGRS